MGIEVFLVMGLGYGERRRRGERWDQERVEKRRREVRAEGEGYERLYGRKIREGIFGGGGWREGFCEWGYGDFILVIWTLLCESSEG